MLVALPPTTTFLCLIMVPLQLGWTTCLHDVLKSIISNRLSPPKSQNGAISLELGEAVWIKRFMDSTNHRSGISHLPEPDGYQTCRKWKDTGTACSSSSPNSSLCLLRPTLAASMFSNQKTHGGTQPQPPRPWSPPSCSQPAGSGHCSSW